MNSEDERVAPQSPSLHRNQCLSTPTRVHTCSPEPGFVPPPTHIAQKPPPGAAPWTQQCEALSFPFLIKNENGRKKNVQLV